MKIKVLASLFLWAMLAAPTAFGKIVPQAQPLNQSDLFHQILQIGSLRMIMSIRDLKPKHLTALRQMEL